MGKILVAIIVPLLLVGCATTPKINTPSGKPEIIIQGAAKKQIIDNLTNLMITQGYSVKSINEYNAIYGKRNTDLGSALLFGSQWDMQPEARISYNIFDVENGIRIVTTMEMITNPDTGFERKMDLSAGASAQKIQKILDDVKTSLEKK